MRRIAALQQALVLARGTVATDPLQLLLVQARLAAGQTAEASAPRASDDPVTSEFLAALAAFAQCNWPEAERLLRRLAEFAPTRIATSAAGWLGRALLAQGDATGAEPWLSDALHADAADAELWIVWSQTHIALGQSAEALEGLELALRMLPGHAALEAARSAAARQAGETPSLWLSAGPG